MYVVHMRTITATEARKSWFRLLDAAVDGEVVVIDRNGVRVELRRAATEAEEGWEPPDYGRVLRVAEAERADEWGWEWDAASGELRLVDPGGP